MRGRAAAVLCMLIAAACARSHDRERRDAGEDAAGFDANGLDGAGLDADGIDAGPADSGACGQLLEVRFIPAARVQMAIWLEGPGLFRTLYLTEAVALRGIGNRPGALQMNSGFRWPYGRREGVLPGWAHSREASGAPLFRRVIFQNRASEGFCDRTEEDHSLDEYFCLSFNERLSRRDELDAVSCASFFHSDKGRFITDADVASGYAEPFEEMPGSGMMRPLSRFSRYPPRRDVVRCSREPCFDHADVDRYEADARTAMPEIDAVTHATATGGSEQRLWVPIPPDLAPGAYTVVVEANSEGDYNDVYGADAYPTPESPADRWDYWASQYGYPYRGQPSVVFRVEVVLNGTAGVTARADVPAFYTSVHGLAPELHPFGDGAITDDPSRAPGSGADRLLRSADGARVQVTTLPCR